MMFKQEIKSAGSLANFLRVRFTDSQRFMLLCLIVGLSCGLAAVAFHWVIHSLFDVVWHTAIQSSKPLFVLIMLGAPTLAGLLVGVVVQKWAPDAAGSGIPQTKIAYYNKGGKISIFTGLWRFMLGAVYVGLGNSLGREGPTVHFSAAIASRLGRWAFRDASRVQSMLPVGMAAGIAAAFNAPISALTFVFEELLDNFSMKALGGMVVAVVIAAAASRTLLGEDPVLNTHLIGDYTTSGWMFVALPLGLLAGIIGYGFTRSVLGLRLKFKEWKCPKWLNPAIGGLSCGLIGLLAWQLTGYVGEAQNSVFSIGYESLELAFQNKLTLTAITVLLILKMFAVVVTYASGGSGGLFSPTLYLGGMLGALAGLVLTQVHQFSPWIPNFPDTAQVVGGCVLLGMGAMFASVVRCPFTSLIIIFELTGNYSLILPLMAGNMLAYGLSRRLQPVSMYNALIMQDGVNLRSLPAYQGVQDYRKLPIQAIMTYQPYTLFVKATTGESLKMIRETNHSYHAYPVVDADDKLCGVITLHELRENSTETTIESLIQNQDLLVINQNSSIHQAARAMVSRDYQQAPIVAPNDEQKLIGWVTMNDIVRQQNTLEADEA